MRVTAGPRRQRDDRGVTAVVVALVMTGLLSVSAVTLDYGSASVVRRQTQNAADAAARAVAEKCARAGGVTAACLTLTADETGIVQGNAGSSVVESVTQPSPGRVKVTVRKKVTYQLASLLGRSSDQVRSSATASLSGVHPTEGYPVLPLAASYCTWKNNSTYAGTATEANYKIALRTDTLQSLTSLLTPLTTTARSVLETSGVLKELGTTPLDQCADVDGTQIGTLKGAVWLTGETVVSDVTSGLFGWDASKCELRAGSDLKTFLGVLRAEDSSLPDARPSSATASRSTSARPS